MIRNTFSNLDTPECLIERGGGGGGGINGGLENSSKLNKRRGWNKQRGWKNL